MSGEPKERRKERKGILRTIILGKNFVVHKTWNLGDLNVSIRKHLYKWQILCTLHLPLLN